MIIDRFENAALYFPLHRGFERAFAYLQAHDFRTMEPGRYPIEGDLLYVMISDDKGKGPDAVLEAHKNYLDIHLTVQGTEVIGWRSLSDCHSVKTPYNDKKDIVFFADDSELAVSLPAGVFAVIFPHDAHAPLMGDDVRKVVVKIRMEWPE